MRLFRILLAALALVVLASACRVDAEVAIDVAEDGSGTVEVTVTLDGEAAAAVGDPARIRTQDMVDAGWKVAEPEVSADDTVVLVATRDVASPAQLVTVLEEVGGVDGVFRDVRLSVEDGFWSASYDFSARVVLSGDPAQFSDAAVTEALGGLPLGRTPEELAAASPDGDWLGLSVRVTLPGDEPDATWEFAPSGSEAVDTEISTSSSDDSALGTALLYAGVAAVVLGLVLGVVAVVLRRGSR